MKGLTLFVLCVALSLPAFAGQAAPKVRAEMLVSTDWLSKHLRDKNLAVLHVARERKAYDEGHVPGARFLPLGELLTTRNGLANELPPADHLQRVFESLGIGNEGRIVLYGDANGLAAARAFFTLDYLGHGDRAALLDGGLEKWKAEQRPLETAAAATAATAATAMAPFTPKLRPAVVTTLNAMRDLSWAATQGPAPNVALIDARPEDQYLGKPNERSGHIPGAASVFWMTALRSNTDLALKPAADLQKLFADAGLKPGQKVVTYCNTGMQASHAYFTLKYLGYDVTMYDGSFSEWSKADGTPIVTGKEKK